jgi:predicted SpoU family rRNA methylase
MTINQAIDKLTRNGKKLNEEQKKLYDSLMNVKMEFGGRTMIENVEQVNNIIEHSSKEGKK